MQIYLVGGAVRDKLLNLPIHDRDWVVVGATPEVMLKQDFRQTGKDFPVFLHPDTHEEYALARTERKSGSGHTGFVCHSAPNVTLEEDLLRRDLTINAIAEDEEGNLIDPYGGVRDIEAKKLRHVSDAFSEDPLRVLRVARFAARFASMGFSIADETLKLMTQMSLGTELLTLPSERVWQEVQTGLSEASPRTFIEVLRSCGALKTLLPEVDALFGVPQPETHHPEIDTGLHILLALDYCTKMQFEPEVRFAVLVHDLGKAVTASEAWPQHIAHENKGVPIVKKLCSRLKAPRRYTDLALLSCQYHTHCHRALELKASTIVKLFNQLDVWRKPDRFTLFLQSCEADARGRKGLNDTPYPQVDFLIQAYDACREVNAKQFVEEGLSGNAISERIYNERVRRIKNFKNSKPAQAGKAK